jgi:hypothetical protein
MLQLRQLTGHFLRMPFQWLELLERPNIKQPDQPISSCRSDKMTVPTPLALMTALCVRLRASRRR